jgi:hypothetical protein
LKIEAWSGHAANLRKIREQGWESPLLIHGMQEGKSECANFSRFVCYGVFALFFRSAIEEPVEQKQPKLAP